MARPDICVVINAGSGKQGAAGTPDDVKRAFADAGIEVAMKIVQPGEAIEAEAREAVGDGYATIVAAGGDGTICAVAAALNGSGRTMGIVPLGTFNYFARSLDLPQELVPAVQVIVDHHAVPLRIAMINDRVFLNNASFGAYPAILAARENIYRRFGRSRVAAYWSVLSTLAKLRSPMRLRIVTGGTDKNVRTPLVFVVNNAFQLDQMGLEGRDRIAAGELVVFIAPDAGRLGMLRHALALAAGRAQTERNFAMVSGAEIEITGRGRDPLRARHVARDGERERLTGPFRLRVVPDALQVIVPRTRDAEIR